MKYKLYQLQHSENETEEVAELIHNHLFTEDITSEILPYYKFVAMVEAEDLEDAFYIMNVGESDGDVRRFLPTRSMSVSDILVDEYGKVFLCGMSSWIEMSDETRILLPLRATVQFLDYEIVNSGNGDNWVVTKPSGELWETHLGNYINLEEAKKDCVLNFMIARPAQFATHIRRYVEHSSTYMEWHVFQREVQRAGLTMPDEIGHSADMNALLLFNGEKLF